MFIRSFPVISTIGSAAMVTIIPSRYVKVFQESQLLPSSLYSTSPDSQSWFGTLTLSCFVFWKANFEESRNIETLFKKYAFVTVSDLRSWCIFWEGEVYGLSSKMWHHWLSTLSPLPTHLTNIFIKHFLVNVSSNWLECNFNNQDHQFFVIFWGGNNKMFFFSFSIPSSFGTQDFYFQTKHHFLWLKIATETFQCCHRSILKLKTIVFDIPRRKA